MVMFGLNIDNSSQKVEILYQFTWTDIQKSRNTLPVYVDRHPKKVEILYQFTWTDIQKK